MTSWSSLLAAWNPQPTVIGGAAAVLAAYVVALHAKPVGTPRRRSVCFVSGVLLIVLALVSPLDALSDTYLFSAHMLQHLLLVLVAPPLLVLGIPRGTLERVLEVAILRAIERHLRHPVTAWVIGIGTLWIWHLPTLYDAALASESLHAFEHLCFLVSATVFWWPILTSLPEPHRLAPLVAIAYLIAAGVASSLLGIVVTFAPVGLYAPYLHPGDRLGILALVRDAWGLSPTIDQQVGGLLMWVVGMPIYLLAVIVTLARWYAEPDGELMAPAQGS